MEQRLPEENDQQIFLGQAGGKSWRNAGIIAAAIIFALLIFFLADSSANEPARPAARNTEKARAELPSRNLSKGDLSLIMLPDDGISPVLSLIRNASRTIDLVMYESQDKTIDDELAKAAKRGVAVRVLLNRGYYGKQQTRADALNEASFADLQSQGISVEWTPASFALTHQKTIIADGDAALIMTFNFVPVYYATGRDFAILDRDANDAKAIEDTFNADWQDRGNVFERGDDLLWSPGSEKDILLIIASAKKSLDVYNEEMNDPKVTRALGAAAERGVDVRIVMTYEDSEKAAFRELSSAGAEIRTFSGKKSLYIHAKAIIADDRYAFLGSENFSYTSLEKNRELGIFISDPAIIGSLESTFGKDFGNGRKF